MNPDIETIHVADLNKQATKQAISPSSPACLISTLVGSGRKASLIAVIALFALIMAIPGHALNFSPFPGNSNQRNAPPPQPPGPWGWRPQQPNNARGVPPGYPAPQQPSAPPGYQRYPQPSGRPGYQPPQQPAVRPGYQAPWQTPYGGGYPQAQTRSTSSAPYLEIEVTDRSPYVQENVLVKLRVISESNLDTANPELPSTNDILIQKLESVPKADTRTNKQGQREIVNEFLLTLIPLRSGDVIIPPIKVTGSTAADAYGRGSRSYSVSTNRETRLQVRPAMSAVSPWLPLQDLRLKATLDSGEDVEEGKPVTLALEMSAVGTTGAHLPSLESLLHSPDFRVYREQTLAEGGPSSDGRRILGKRTEYYTLVPHSGGRLQLPEVSLAWWNVDKGTRELATLPIHTLQVEGESGPYGLPRSVEKEAGMGWSGLWLPLAGLLMMLLGYWFGVWYKGRGEARPLRIDPRIGTTLRAGAQASADGIRQAASRLNPSPLFARLKPDLTGMLPPPARLWWSVRDADHESDPHAWSRRFQGLACKHLNLDPNESLLRISDKIAQRRPPAEREKLARLMDQLDGALYGGQDIDFRSWKQQFRRHTGLFSIIRKTREDRPGLFTRSRLPALNP